MARLVGMEWYFLVVVRILWGLVVGPRIDLRRRGRCQGLGRLLRFERLPSVLLVPNFRASKFLPSTLNQR